MNLKLLTRPTSFFLVLISISALNVVVVQNAIGATVRAPKLNCSGSGELSGMHPGWSSSGAQQLTVVEVSSNNFNLYWCPAAAPQGVGPISYTVTSMLGAITCETTLLFCSMRGISSISNLSLMATDETGSYASDGPAIQNSGLLYTCIKSAMKCNLGPGIQSYPTYGNIAPMGLGSCTFAAVANWQQIALGLHPDPALIYKEYLAAGGNANVGLTTDQVFNYWRTFGVAGVFLKNSDALAIDPINLQRAIDDPNVRTVIASLNLVKNQNFAGTSNLNPSYHWVVVTGYTPQGPLVVTWGQTLQTTWQQWNLEAVTMWRIGTGNDLKSLVEN